MWKLRGHVSPATKNYPTGAPLSQETPQAPTAALCPGLYDGPGGVACSHEQGTPVFRAGEIDPSDTYSNSVGGCRAAPPLDESKYIIPQTLDRSGHFWV